MAVFSISGMKSQSDTKLTTSSPIYVTICALSVLLMNEFYGYSKYVKPITKTLASIGFLIAGINYELLNSDQGNYVFIG